MTDENQGEVVSATAKCIACRLAIEPDATICVHCKSRQDWHRHLNFSGTILALLVALLSVLGVTIPTLQKAFHTPKSKVAVELLNVGGIKPRGGISMTGHWTEFTYMLECQLVITNSGDSSGVVSEGFLDLKLGKQSLATGSFIIKEPNNPIPADTVRVVDILVPLQTQDQTRFPSQIRDGVNGRLLDATAGPEADSAGMKEIPPIDVSSGSLKISAIQSDGTRTEFNLGIKPRILTFNVN